MTDMHPEVRARLIKDLHQASRVMAETGTFETGQGLMLDAAAEIARLREELAEARGALEPFDWALSSARERLGDMPDKNDVTALAVRFISHDHLKDARAALQENKDG